MRQVISLLLIFCLFTAPLRANLGETVKQCIARYGRPNGYSEPGPKTPFGTIVFMAGNFVLAVIVYNNVEVAARVSKSDKSAFSDVELKAIMDSDTTGAGWTSIKSDDPTCLAWQRDDKATVLYDNVHHMVLFASPAMNEAINSFSAKPAPAEPSSSNAATTNAAPAN